MADIATTAGDAHALLGQMERAAAEFGLIVSSPGLPEQVRIDNLADIERVVDRVRVAVRASGNPHDPAES